MTQWVQKVRRVFRTDGWPGLFSRARKRYDLYRLQAADRRRSSARGRGRRASAPDAAALAAVWLDDNRSRFDCPFHVLLNFLGELHRQSAALPPVSCRRYRDCLAAGAVDELPFAVARPPVAERDDDILAYIADYDEAEFRRMVHGTFVGLLRHQLENRETPALLDFGTGPACGMYNERYRDELFGDLDLDRVRFTGIDSVHRPAGAGFARAEYRKADIAAFAAERKFDLVTGHHVLEHCYRWEAVVGRIGELLAPGGWVYLSFPRYGGFYDTVYRLLTPLDHCASFDVELLATTAAAHGLVLKRAATYVDPRSRFGWLCEALPKLIERDIADAFYDLCVGIDARRLLGLHLYGHYVVFQKE
ncbi:MAG: methyltransferase domain-containing protein [Deltaproteobacteria bacterium]|nr:methyltransferase domain-containing protein [Candidatus Anaeroferrophillacea bacterium]